MNQPYETVEILGELELQTDTKYDFVRMLDGGLSNKAFIAIDTKQSQKVVIKYLDTPIPDENSPYQECLALNNYVEESKVSQILSDNFDFIYPVVAINDVFCTIQPFIEGETMANESMHDSETLKEVALTLCELHNKDIVSDDIKEFNTPGLYKSYLEKLKAIEDKIGAKFYQEYLRNINGRTGRFIKSIDNLLKTKRVCHNDALAGNFIKTVDGSMNLIDFEYAGYNYPLWDVVSVITECKLGYTEATYLLDIYRKNTNILEYKTMSTDAWNLIIHMMQFIQNDLWSMWGLIRCRDRRTGYIVDKELKIWAEEKRHNRMLSKSWKTENTLINVLNDKLHQQNK